MDGHRFAPDADSKDVITLVGACLQVRHGDRRAEGGGRGAARDGAAGLAIGEDGVTTIDMTLTSAACPLTDVIEDQAGAALEGLVPGFRINWVWMPPWGPDKITDDGRDQLRALGFTV